jgi:hypothetical protein
MKIQAMISEQRNLRRASLVTPHPAGYQRFSYTPKKDIDPVRSSFRPGPYQFIVEWQLEEESTKPSLQVQW